MISERARVIAQLLDRIMQDTAAVRMLLAEPVAVPEPEAEALAEIRARAIDLGLALDAAGRGVTRRRGAARGSLRADHRAVAGGRRASGHDCWQATTLPLGRPRRRSGWRPGHFLTHSRTRSHHAGGRARPILAYVHSHMRLYGT